MTRIAIVYARSATYDAAALERQKATCRQFAYESDYVIIAEFAEVGSGQAAYLPLREAAIEHAATHGAALLCAEPSRLTRDAAGLAAIMAECQTAGLAVDFAQGA